MEYNKDVLLILRRKYKTWLGDEKSTMVKMKQAWKDKHNFNFKEVVKVMYVK